MYPELVVWGAKGEIESIQYHELMPMLLNELQKQAREIRQLKARQEREIGALEARLAVLEHQQAVNNAHGDLAVALER